MTDNKDDEEAYVDEDDDSSDEDAIKRDQPKKKPRRTTTKKTASGKKKASKPTRSSSALNLALKLRKMCWLQTCEVKEDVLSCYLMKLASTHYLDNKLQTCFVVT